jgi:hypothetical protein
VAQFRTPDSLELVGENNEFEPFNEDPHVSYYKGTLFKTALYAASQIIGRFHHLVHGFTLTQRHFSANQGHRKLYMMICVNCYILL